MPCLPGVRIPLAFHALIFSVCRFAITNLTYGFYGDVLLLGGGELYWRSRLFVGLDRYLSLSLSPTQLEIYAFLVLNCSLKEQECCGTCLCKGAVKSLGFGNVCLLDGMKNHTIPQEK